MSKSFAGTFRVAVITTLPELVVAVVKLGSINIVVGNLLGSNIFNMLILVLDDDVYHMSTASVVSHSKWLGYTVNDFLHPL